MLIFIKNFDFINKHGELVPISRLLHDFGICFFVFSETAWKVSFKNMFAFCGGTYKVGPKIKDMCYTTGAIINYPHCQIKIEWVLDLNLAILVIWKQPYMHFITRKVTRQLQRHDHTSQETDMDSYLIKYCFELAKIPAVGIDIQTKRIICLLKPQASSIEPSCLAGSH